MTDGRTDRGAHEKFHSLKIKTILFLTPCKRNLSNLYDIKMRKTFYHILNHVLMNSRFQPHHTTHIFFPKVVRLNGIHSLKSRKKAFNHFLILEFLIFPFPLFRFLLASCVKMLTFEGKSQWDMFGRLWWRTFGRHMLLDICSKHNADIDVYTIPSG